MRLATAAALLAVWSGCSERDEPVIPVPLDCTFDDSATPATSQDLVLCALVVLSTVSDWPPWDGLYRRSDDEIWCLATSTTREQAQACLGRTYSPGDTCESPYPDADLRCEGDSLVECSESGTLVIDCSRDLESSGPTCLDTRGQLGPGCSSPGTCTEGERKCEGNFLLECVQDRDTGIWLSGWNCAPDTCGEEGGTAACVPVDRVPCDEIGASRCEMTDEGEVYVECSGPEPAHEVRVACHRLAGAVCDTERGCEMSGSVCDELPEYGSGQCRDEGMLYCGFGVVREFDCTAIGFETCEQEVLPDDGGGLWLPPECVD